MTTPAKAVEIFYSYAHEDKKLRDELEKHLMSLRRQGLVTLWHDRKISAGTEWAQTIDTHLNTASIILLLISPDFLASDYCYDVEMTRALERHDAKEARVIPVILRPVDWHRALFGKLQALPQDGKAVTSWPNRDKAFLDVVIGIRVAIEELKTPTGSLQAPASQIWNVPFRRNPFFTGQETIITHLHHGLATNTVEALTQPQAISGLAGIGKTQIALEYAYRHRAEYRAVLWVRADSRGSLVLDFVALASLLQLPERDTQDQDSTIQAMKHWLDTHDGWLLIFDNADDVVLARDFFPTEGTGHILLTTRATALRPIAQSIEVETMSPDEGSVFLLRRVGLLPLDAPPDQISASDHAEAWELVQELGGLPLALDQAGAYIEETGCGVSGYLERYRSQRTQLLKRRGKLVTDHPESVVATWTLSFQRVEQVNRAAADLLQFCAFLHPDAIPEELIMLGARDLGPPLRAIADDLIAQDEAMEILRTYSLLRRIAETRTLSIHRLVQTVLRDGMRKVQQRRWAQRAVRVVARIFPDPQDVNAWPFFERYLLHAQVCARLIDQWNMTSDEAPYLLNQAALYFEEHAQYTEALPLYQQALSIRERTLGPEHPDVAQSLNNLAALYRAQGRYEEAEPLYQQALSIRERVLEPNHPDIATSLNNLAALYHAQGQYEQAEPLLRRALSIWEQALGPNHPNVAASLNNLAESYRTQGQYKQAELLLRRALSIWEQALGPNHPNVAASLHNLATIYHAQGQYEQAEPLYQQALAIREQALGPDHPDVAQSLNSLAGLYSAQGHYEQAELLYQQALAILIPRLGPRHPHTLIVQKHYAALRQKMQ